MWCVIELIDVVALGVMADILGLEQIPVADFGQFKPRPFSLQHALVCIAGVAGHLVFLAGEKISFFDKRAFLDENLVAFPRLATRKVDVGAWLGDRLTLVAPK